MANAVLEGCDLVRVVGRAEYAGLRAGSPFRLAFGGIEEKQFWFDLESARWFVDRVMRRGWAAPPFWAVAVHAQSDTLAAGVRFADVGYDAISFSATGLHLLNADLRRNGLTVVQHWE